MVWNGDRDREYCFFHRSFPLVYSAHGWLYVFGVGVLGGMALHKRTEPAAAETGATFRHPDPAAIQWQ